MQKVSAVLEKERARDDEGRLVLGNPWRGCRHCGTVEVKEAKNGKALLWHPGVECCAAAISDQIRYRMGEIDGFEKQLGEREESLSQLQADADIYGEGNRSNDASRARVACERALASFDRATQPIKNRIAEAAREINRLKARRAELPK